MNYSKEHISQLLASFTAGQTTEAEEQLLADYFSSASDIPSEWHAYKAIFDSFTTDAYDFPSADADALITPVPRRHPFSQWLSVACAAAIFFFIFFYPAAQASRSDISTSEILETISLLSDAGVADIHSVTPAPNGNGFIVSTTGLSYRMQRSADGQSIKLTQL